MGVFTGVQVPLETRGVLDPGKLELQAVVSQSMCVSGTELRPSLCSTYTYLLSISLRYMWTPGDNFGK